MTSNLGPRRLTRAAALAVVTLMALAPSPASAGFGHCKKVYVLVDDAPAPTTTRVVRRYVREVAAPDAQADRDVPSPQAPARDAAPPAKTMPEPAARAAEPAPAPRTVTRRVLRTYVEEEQVPAEEVREVATRDVPVTRTYVTREVPATRVVRVVRTVPAERVVVREVAPATEAILVTKKHCLFGRGY